MFHVPVVESSVRDGDVMVARPGEPHRYVNAALHGVRSPDGPSAWADGLPPHTFGTARLAVNYQSKVFLSEFWRPASRPMTSRRFVCSEPICWPAELRPTVGPTVWLNGALLLVVTQAGYGIIRGKRSAKLKMLGVKLATPQKPPLSHSLWTDVSTIKTESDNRLLTDYCPDVVDPEEDNEGDGFKKAKRQAAEERAALLQGSSSKGEVTVVGRSQSGTRESSRMMVPTLGMIDILLCDGQQSPLPSERGVWREAFQGRLNAGGHHPLTFTFKYLAKQPGGGEYSPIWYRTRKWCEGLEGYAHNLGGLNQVLKISRMIKGTGAKIGYLGSVSTREIRPVPPKWPFNYMRKGVGDDLYDVGRMHRLLWQARSHSAQLRYHGAVASLEKRQALTRKPIAEVIAAVIVGNSTIGSIRHLSQYSNNSYASRELMSILCDGLRVLQAYFDLTGGWEETSCPVSKWVDTTYPDEKGHGVDILEPAWPTHWSQALREHKYREEQDGKKARGGID